MKEHLNYINLMEVCSLIINNDLLSKESILSESKKEAVTRLFETATKAIIACSGTQ